VRLQQPPAADIINGHCHFTELGMMKAITAVNPFRCRMWDLHDGLEDLIMSPRADQ